MKKNTVVLDFVKFLVPDKMVFGRIVLAKMSPIALFANPDVAYATVIAIVNRMEAVDRASLTMLNLR